MVEVVEIKLSPSESNDDSRIVEESLKRSKQKGKALEDWRVVKKSIDARGKSVLFQMRIELYFGEKIIPEPALLDLLQPVHDKTPVLIIGAGPAGYFAALELIELGLRPIIFDRGKRCTY